MQEKRMYVEYIWMSQNYDRAVYIKLLDGARDRVCNCFPIVQVLPTYRLLQPVRISTHFQGSGMASTIAKDWTQGRIQYCA